MSSSLLAAPGRAGSLPSPRIAAALLAGAARFWFGVMLIGQWLFVAHIAGAYGRSGFTGHFAAWNKTLAQGWIAGDPVGNALLALHLAMAAYLSFGGVLQLIPRLRTAMPRLHRVNGRVYLVMAVLASGSALYLSLVRGHALGSPLDHAAVRVNGLLILLFAGLAFASARARQFAVHRRHAIRLVLVVSGVFFFRIEVFGWMLLNGGPRGFDPETFTGPVLTVFGFAQYLLPLAMFELYERARAQPAPVLKTVTATLLTGLTLVMVTGLVALGAYWF